MCIENHKFLLRIEGVNLDRILTDTTQLSVIRGGSMLLRQAAKRIESHLKKTDPHILLEPVSTGASVGLYRFRASARKAEAVRNEAAHCLSEGCLSDKKEYRHLTFVVDVQRLGDDFQYAREAVIARNRFRQMQQLSVPLPETVDNNKGPCSWDGVRPAVTPAKAAGNPRASESANARFNFGKEEKTKFFAEETVDPKIADLHFTNDFEELAGKARDQPLENKLAVIYLDGNGFGQLQDECPTPEKLQEFDKVIRKSRSAYLAKFLHEIEHDQAFLFRDTQNAKERPRLEVNADESRPLPLAGGGQGGGRTLGTCEESQHLGDLSPSPPSLSKGEGVERLESTALRLEVLLWGGDEILLVVPAWQGFRTLQFFYEQSRDWKWDKKPMTHAGALIFCNCKTPIDRMTALARELAQMVKESPGGRDRDLFDYVVLESVDFPTEPLWKFWLKRYGDLADRRTPLSPVRLPKWKAAIEVLQKMRKQEEIPRSRLEPAMQRLVVPRGGDAKLHEAKIRLEKVLEGTDEDRKWSEPVRAQLKELFSAQDECWQWLHLIELWDYLLPWQEQGTLAGMEEKQDA